MNWAAELQVLIQSWRMDVISAFIVFLRVGAAMALMPAFGEQTIPLRVRLALAIMFTLVVLPMVATAPWFPHEMPPPSVYFFEGLSGLLLGMFFRLFVSILQVAGTIAAQATSLSQIFGGGATPDPMPAFGTLFVIGGLTFAMMNGLHVKLALTLAGSYDYLEFGAFPNPGDVMTWGVSGVSRAFAAAFSLAAPFVLASVIYNVAIGVINKAMPQLQVAFIGAPAITLGGLAILAIATPLVFTVWLEKFDAGLASPTGGFW